MKAEGGDVAGIGRRSGLKTRGPKGREGSTPSVPTNLETWTTANTVHGVEPGSAATLCGRPLTDRWWKLNARVYLPLLDCKHCEKEIEKMDQPEEACLDCGQGAELYCDHCGQDVCDGCAEFGDGIAYCAECWECGAAEMYL